MIGMIGKIGKIQRSEKSEKSAALSRRHMIQSLCGGLGGVGLTALLGTRQADAAALGHYAAPMLPAKAKQVIFLFMAGGPSQIDMFDPKPLLVKYQGERPDSGNFRPERQ